MAGDAGSTPAKHNEVRSYDRPDAHSSSLSFFFFFFLFSPVITFVAENKREKVIIFSVFSGNYTHAIRIHLTPSVLSVCLLKRSEATVMTVPSTSGAPSYWNGMEIKDNHLQPKLNSFCLRTRAKQHRKRGIGKNGRG